MILDDEDLDKVAGGRIGHVPKFLEDQIIL